MGRSEDRFPRPTRRAAPTLAGVHRAIVVDNVDPLGAGRVQVAIASVDGAASVWAPVAMASAGMGHGTWCLPAEGDLVVVAFEGGDVAQPIVVGSLWSSGVQPPELGEQQTDRTTILTRSGSRISIDDATPGGSITVQTGAGDSIRITAAGIDITASATVHVTATTVDVQAASVTFESPMVSFTGVVRCATLLADSVVASSYSPGAGNIW